MATETLHPESDEAMAARIDAVLKRVLPDDGPTYVITAPQLETIREALEHGAKLEKFGHAANATLYAIDEMEAFQGLPVVEDDRIKQEMGNFLLDRLTADARALDPGLEKYGDISMALDMVERLAVEAQPAAA
ncbi:hypothetical protein [Rhizorhapis sp. SPR117]|uniref:hypothetical protein n=1 Tax=Rhizorhapis sp. SPR117 TaxID=2912611 RepID=UPI001F40CD88|nr:hypothetical protein [Rhizorhapis sp. SPR117]